jgi:hypothetical protein
MLHERTKLPSVTIGLDERTKLKLEASKQNKVPIFKTVAGKLEALSLESAEPL